MLCRSFLVVKSVGCFFSLLFFFSLFHRLSVHARLFPSLPQAFPSPFFIICQCPLVYFPLPLLLFTTGFPFSLLHRLSVPSFKSTPSYTVYHRLSLPPFSSSRLSVPSSKSISFLHLPFTTGFPFSRFHRLSVPCLRSISFLHYHRLSLLPFPFFLSFCSAATSRNQKSIVQFSAISTTWYHVLCAMLRAMCDAILQIFLF